MFEANPEELPVMFLPCCRSWVIRQLLLEKLGGRYFWYKTEKRVKGSRIDTSGLVIDKDARTTLAFVQTLKGGDRDFSFTVIQGADMMLRSDEVNNKLIKNCAIFHFGTLSMTHKEVSKTTKKGD